MEGGVSTVAIIFVGSMLTGDSGCNAIYEDQYLLGTSLARPVIAKGMMKA